MHVVTPKYCKWLVLLLTLLAAGFNLQAEHDRKVTRLEIFPSHIAVKAEDTLQFTAVAHTDLGTAYTPERLRWSATGGTVSDEGKFIAGPEAGWYQVTVKLRHLQATARVEVKVFAPQIARIEVAPVSVAVDFGQSCQFQAIAYDQYNRIVPFVPLWTATGGQINNLGQYTATGLGQFVVTAQDQQSGIFGRGSVTVRSSIAKVEITPPSAMMRVGQTAQFSATAYDRFGRPMAASFVWSATGGQISQTGAYTAVAAGTFQLIAQERSSGIQALATVQVTGHVTPPPTPSVGRIVVTRWDVGGGNFFTPAAKIDLETHGANAQTVKLFSVSSTGGMNELQARSCSNGSVINFNTKYDRFATAYIEIRLYDNMNQVIAKEKRAVN